MKKTSFSSHIFWLLSCIFISSSYAQKPIDSAFFYFDKVLKPTSSTDLPAGYNYYKKHKEQSLLAKDTLTAISDLRMLAISEYELGRMYDSEVSAVEALILIDQLGVENTSLTNARLALFNQLGLIYETTHNDSSALQIYDKALALVTQQSDSLTLLNNKALIHRNLGNYSLAEADLKVVYEKSLQGTQKTQIARAQDNLGFVQSKLGKEEGITHMLAALKIREEAQDEPGLYANYMHLHDYYLGQNDTTQAVFYAILAKEKADSLSVSYKIDALSHLARFNKDPNVIAYLALTDSITDAKQETQNTFAAARYNLEKEQQRTQKSELQREKEKRLKVIYLFLGIFISFLAVVLYFFLKVRHAKEKRKKVYETELRISKKVHDEVANDLYQVMTKIQGATATSETLLDDLEAIYSKTRDISKENSSIDVSQPFEATLNDLLSSYQTETVSIVTRNLRTIAWKDLSEAKKTALYRVLQELMTNMRKHSKATAVAIIFQQQGKKLVISYSDNGVGSKFKKNNGLQNVENRIQTIKGTLTFETEQGKGFKVKMTL